MKYAEIDYCDGPWPYSLMELLRGGSRNRRKGTGATLKRQARTAPIKALYTDAGGLSIVINIFAAKREVLCRIHSELSRRDHTVIYRKMICCPLDMMPCYYHIKTLNGR